MDTEQTRSIYVIRHAQSQYNLAEAKCHEEGRHLHEIKFSMELIDCGITDHGFTQTKSAADEMKNVNVTLVYVSPLRRALLTAREIFKDHPNKPQIKVLPICREFIDSSCDIPDDLNKIMKEFPEVDFSEMDIFEDKDMWIIESLHNETLREDLLKQAKETVAKSENRGHDFRKFITEYQRKIYPTIFDPPKDVRDRSIKAKKLLKEKLKHHKEEVAVVSHSAFLYRFTSTKFDEEAKPIDGVFLDNCQVMKVTF